MGPDKKMFTDSSSVPLCNRFQILDELPQTESCQQDDQLGDEEEKCGLKNLHKPASKKYST